MSGQTHISPQIPAVTIDGIDLAPEIRTRLRNLIDTLPDQPARLRVMGHVLLDMGLGSLALDAFGRALLLDDLDPATHLGLTRTYLQNGARETALEHLEIAISLRPDARELRVVAADLVGCRDRMRAFNQLGAVLSADPDHAGARKGLAALIRSEITSRIQEDKSATWKVPADTARVWGLQDHMPAQELSPPQPWFLN